MCSIYTQQELTASGEPLIISRLCFSNMAEKI